MSQNIGNILESLRKEKRYSQEKLSRGICDASELAKLEMNAVQPKPFRVDRLFERLGMSTERLEYMLSRENYEVYEIRYQIQTAVLYRNLELACKFLNQYEKKKCAGKVLHRQFIEQERAQIAWLRGESVENVLKYLNQAIEQTMPLEKAVESGMALSAEEVKLLLFRWEVSAGTPMERHQAELWTVLNYLEENRFVSEEKVKVYPYVVLLLAEYARTARERAYILELAEEALNLLREEGRILYMTEILELYATLLEETEDRVDKIHEIWEMRDALLAVEEECGVYFENYRLFQHLNRTFELDYEVIRKSRIACGMSQEELCECICTQEHLSRIERGKTRANRETLEKLLGRMNRKRNRVGMFVATERYEVIALEREIVRCRQRFEYERAEALLQEIESKLDMSLLENRQYILTEQIETALKKHEIKEQEAIDRLEEILQISLEHEESAQWIHRLTHLESNILNRIAMLLCDIHEKNRAEKIWSALATNYEKSDVNVVFNVRDWELMVGNHASVLLDLEIPEVSLEISYRRLRTALEVGKGNGIGRSLTLMACALETQNSDECKKRFQQALHILKLTKMEHRYLCVKEYVEERGILR